VAADKPIRVLIADDSLVAREMLAQILATDSGIEVVGMARDGSEAVDAVAQLEPDLVTMDIHMPKMDGLQAIEQIMAYHPTPILVVSSSVHGEGIGRAFDALSMGALEVLKKPEPRDWADLEQIGSEIIRKVKLLARVRVITHIRGRRERPRVVQPGPELKTGSRSIVAIGSSTGGPTALLSILGRLPADFPVPIVVAQHIAEGFVPGLVSWLDSGCQLTIQMAAEGRDVAGGYAYLAPTGVNLVMDGLVMRFEEPRSGQLYIPSADTLFESVCESYGRGAIGVILTGMGADGARGLKCMREAGASTIAQDEETSTVFGMPKAAVEHGAAEHVMPIDEMAGAIMQMVEAESAE
jgi:two-component system chemotaxis response regulator CheB